MDTDFDDANAQRVGKLLPLSLCPSGLGIGRLAPGDQSVTFAEFLSLTEVSLAGLVNGSYRINMFEQQARHRGVGARSQRRRFEVRPMARCRH